MSANLRFALLLAVAGVLGTASSLRAADDFSGKFEGSNLTVEISLKDFAYTGNITLGTQVFPMEAHVDNGGLAGTFSSSGNKFSFTATLASDTLTLSTGGKTYTLKRNAAPVNPLGQQPLNPLLAGAVDAPAGYTVVTATDAGKALSVQKPDANSVMAAMKATFPDLEKYFGVRPTILGAYEDDKDHKSGTASFTAASAGRRVRGLVSCKIGDHGATVAVIYCNADASPAQWTKLTTDAPQAAAAAPVVALKEFKFPDNTGSIGLADGWTTTAQSAMAGIQIKGPADQQVSIGLCVPVQTPDSPLVLMHQQLVANARRSGFSQPPPLKLLIAPYAGPVDAMNSLVPQFSKLNQDAGSFAIEIDSLKELPQQVKPSLPNGKAALVSYGITHDLDGKTSHYLGGARIETTPIGNGAWMYFVTEIAAPDKSFETDTPVMLAMINSLKENQEVIAEKTRQNLDESNRKFAAMQQAHKQQMEGYDQQNKAWARRSLDQSRSNTDFDEVIRGDRTVLDTQTGNRTSVDLGNVDAIVDRLNQADPGRYKQIPLRDEIYPLPENAR